MWLAVVIAVAVMVGMGLTVKGLEESFELEELCLSPKSSLLMEILGKDHSWVPQVVENVPEENPVSVDEYFSLWVFGDGVETCNKRQQDCEQ